MNKFALLAVAAVALSVQASDYTRDGGTADWMCCNDKECTSIIVQKADAVRARDECGKLVDQDGVTRYIRSNAFRITGAAPTPTCPPKPADETRAGTCPTGTTGNWTQTKTYASAPHPTCWVGGEWLPASPPSGVCVTTPPATIGAPENLAASMVPNTTNPLNTNVTLTWSAVVGALEYEVWRCNGPACTNFTFLADAPATTYVHLNQPPGLVTKYKVRVWKPSNGLFTSVITVTTPSTPTQANGTATIEWQPPTTNTDGSPLSNLAGFRIVYGATPDALVSTVEVPNPGISSYVVDKLAAGTWYFAVRAYSINGAESGNSNVASKTI